MRHQRALPVNLTAKEYVITAVLMVLVLCWIFSSNVALATTTVDHIVDSENNGESSTIKIAADHHYSAISCKKVLPLIEDNATVKAAMEKIGSPSCYEHSKSGLKLAVFTTTFYPDNPEYQGSCALHASDWGVIAGYCVITKYVSVTTPLLDHLIDEWRNRVCQWDKI